MPITYKKPPEEFSSFMKKEGINIPTKGWSKTSEWKAFKAGLLAESYRLNLLASGIGEDK